MGMLAVTGCGGDDAPVDAATATGGETTGSSAGSTDSEESGGDSGVDATGGSSESSGDGTSATSSDTGDTGTGGDGDGDGDGDGEPAPVLDCGTPTFSDTGVRRYPYLQDVQQESVRVVWTSTNAGAGKVRWAEGPEGPWQEVDASSRAWTTDITEDTEDYTEYEATLDELVPSSAYCYEVLVDDQVVASNLRFDTSWPSNGRKVRILAFGDSGNASAEQAALRDEFLKHDFDVFLHLGDMAYGDGRYTEFEERVFTMYRDLLHRTPTWPTIGNHEYGIANGQPYVDVYHLPEMALQEADQERYYSFDVGDVHFVSLDSNTEMLLKVLAPNNMLDWLRQDLEATDKTWKIVFFHHPPFSSSERTANLQIQLLINPILEEHGVDAVLCGHDHHYERSVPIADAQPTPRDMGGIPYFVVGSGGAGLRTASGDWFTASVNDQKHAFLDLEIDGCNAHGKSVALDGEVIDEFDIAGCL